MTPFEEAIRELSMTRKGCEAILLKARKFVEHSCVVLVDQSKWEVGPLKNYNSTTYKIDARDSDCLKCNCQGFTKRPFCSHTFAVEIATRVGKFRNAYGQRSLKRFGGS